MSVSGNSKLYFWTCSKGHEFSRKIVKFQKGKLRCPVCLHRKLVVKVNDLFSEFPELKHFWNFNENKIDPKFLMANSRSSVNWICSDGHTFPRQVYEFIKNRNCNICNNTFRSKVEIELFNFISEKTSLKVSSNSKILGKLEIDILLESVYKGIEFNGDYWHSDKIIKESKPKFNSAYAYHNFKKNVCMKKGIELAFVWESD